MLHRLVSLTGRGLGAVMIGCVQIYRICFSPMLPPSCRHFPTCSTYAIQAIRKHGPLTGFGLTTWRLLRCHPWGAWGYDPVPEAGLWKRARQRLFGRPDPTGSGLHSRHHPS